MKKLFTLLLAMAGMVSTASAWNYLKGTFNDWKASADYCLDNGPVAVYLTASETAYEFGIDNNGAWKGPNNNASISGTTTLSSFSGSGNFTLTVSTSGYYVFSTNWDNGLALYVSYPNTMVYFCNTLGWENVYLHDGWWKNDDGASNVNAMRGVKMTAGANNIYSAYLPSGTFSKVTFTPDKQVNDGEGQYGAGYTNFYNTSVVWNADDFNSSTPLYVPTTTVGATKNECSYYYGGSWHAYPTYTRDVTPNKFGTICLPFNATLTGATAYKIVSTLGSGDELRGINLEEVDALEAGKAYIFQANADATTITATYSGSYADATEANGMLGYLSSGTTNAPQGSYIVSNNQIHKVIGDDVTVGQYKAYITLTDISAASSRGAIFMGLDNEATGIESIQSKQDGDAIYNLQGQRVTDTGKGIFIVNGKKLLMK